MKLEKPLLSIGQYGDQIVSILNPIIPMYLVNHRTPTVDRRATEALKEAKKHVPERKERTGGSPLDSLPLIDAPKWTVDKIG
jgi:hypothetical protein